MGQIFWYLDDYLKGEILSFLEGYYLSTAFEEFLRAEAKWNHKTSRKEMAEFKDSVRELPHIRFEDLKWEDPILVGKAY